MPKVTKKAGFPVRSDYPEGEAGAAAYMAAVQRHMSGSGPKNEELEKASKNVPERKDKLSNMSEAEMKKNEAKVVAKKTEENKEKAKEFTKTLMKNPELAADAVQLALQGVATSEAPVLSQAAGVLNTLGYGTRGGIKAIKGDKVGAGIYGGLAAGSALGVLPGVGAAADAGNLAILGDKLTKGLKAAGQTAKNIKTTTKGGKALYAAKQPVGDARKVYNTAKESIALPSIDVPYVDSFKKGGRISMRALMSRYK